MWVIGFVALLICVSNFLNLATASTQAVPALTLVALYNEVLKRKRECDQAALAECRARMMELIVDLRTLF